MALIITFFLFSFLSISESNILIELKVKNISGETLSLLDKYIFFKYLSWYKFISIKKNSNLFLINLFLLGLLVIFVIFFLWVSLEVLVFDEVCSFSFSFDLFLFFFNNNFSSDSILILKIIKIIDFYNLLY